MNTTQEQFSDVASLIRAECPEHPVYCIYPHIYRETAKEFLKGFPGRVLYAVKANPEPTVLKLLADSGVRHFDCASVPEIRLVGEACPQGKAYFMIPVWLRGAARQAWEEHGVRHFVIDHETGLATLRSEVPVDRCVVFVRMAVHHEGVGDTAAAAGAIPHGVRHQRDRLDRRVEQ